MGGGVDSDCADCSEPVARGLRPVGRFESMVNEQVFVSIVHSWYRNCMSKAPGVTLVDPSAGIEVVDHVVDSAAGHLNAQHGRLVSAAMWMLDHVDQWQGDGLWTPEAYVRWRTGVAPATASKIVDVARRADEFPECVTALQRGELSLDQITPIARHAPGWCDTQMAGLAPRCTVAQISKIAREYPWELDRDHPAEVVDTDADHAPEGDGARVEADDASRQPVADALQPADEGWFGWDDRGRFRLSLNVGADTGGIIEAALTEARDAEFRAGNTAADTVDAVLEIARRSLAAVSSPDRRNRFRVNVHLELGGRPTDARGRPLPTSVAERITCDALIAPIWCEDGRPVSVGRSQHIVPDRTRRIVEHRDGGCRVPGCRHDRFVEVHHIIHWSAHGPTDTWNLICLCPRHHRLHHQGRLGITGNADVDDGVQFTDAAGRVLAQSGARPEPPGAPPPPIGGIWEHPLGERLDTRWLVFNDDPDRVRSDPRPR